MDKIITCSDHTCNRKSWTPFLVAALFLGCVFGSWFWFHPGLLNSSRGDAIGSEGLWFSCRTSHVDYSFNPKPVAKEALDILSTTNIINGEFTPTWVPQMSQTALSNSPSPSYTRDVELPKRADNSQSQPASIDLFLANWQASSGRGLTVVHHTPDICWVGAGWKPISAGQPEQITLDFPLKVLDPNRSTIGNSDDLASVTAKQVSRPSTIRLPFECRVFKSPNGASKVLVIWCTLVGGQVLSESGLFNDIFKQTEAASPNATARMAAPARRLAADQLWQAVRQRRAARGVKQFVRLSLVISGDWSTALEQVKISALQVVSLSIGPVL